MRYYFFWDTHLSLERQEKINEFLATLSKEQEGMVEDILYDAREETRFDEREGDY